MNQSPTKNAVPATDQAHGTPDRIKLSLQGISKTFDGGRGQPQDVLEAVDLDVRQGEFLALLGPTGCGKSTLLNIVAGLTPQSGGTVVLQPVAHDVADDGLHRADRCLRTADQRRADRPATMADPVVGEGRVSLVADVRPMRRRRTALALVLPVIAVAVWYLTTRSGSKLSYPKPGAVVKSAGDLLDSGQLLSALGTSLVRVLVGFALAVVLGTGIGLLMGRVRWFREVLDPVIETLRPIAPIALVPLAILWLGTGDSSPIAIITYAGFFPVVLNVVAAVREVGDNLVNAARTFGASEVTVFLRVVLPGVVPGIVVGARLGMGLAWTSVIAAELSVGVGTNGSMGIGTLMLTFYQYEVDPNPIVVCMISVGVLGLLLDTVIRGLGRLLTPWER